MHCLQLWRINTCHYCVTPSIYAYRCASQTSAKNQLQAKPLRTHTQRMHELKGIPRPEHVVPLFDNIVCGSELTIWKYCKIRQLNEGTTLQGLGTQAAREPRSCNEFPHLRNRFRQDWLVCSLHWYEKNTLRGICPTPNNRQRIQKQEQLRSLSACC